MRHVPTDDRDIDAVLGETFSKVGESPAVLAQSERLRGLIDAARIQPTPLIDPTKVPVRFTRLKAFSESAAHYLLACQDDFEETIATRIGSGAHASLFENRQVVCFPGRRQGKAWERFEKHYRELGAVILNEDEYLTTIGMVAAIRNHPRAMQLLFDGTTREKTIVWSNAGRACASTPDARTRTIMTELKSARTTEPRAFARDALRRHYHAQLGFYSDAAEASDGYRPDEEFIVAVENVRPHNVVVMRLPDETRLAATKLLRSWWERLHLAEATSTYGGYVEADIELQLPDWQRENDAAPPHVVEIDGKHVFID